jgi:hypothetical protein
LGAGSRGAGVLVGFRCSGFGCLWAVGVRGRGWFGGCGGALLGCEAVSLGWVVVCELYSGREHLCFVL